MFGFCGFLNNNILIFINKPTNKVPYKLVKMTITKKVKLIVFEKSLKMR